VVPEPEPVSLAGDVLEPVIEITPEPAPAKLFRRKPVVIEAEQFRLGETLPFQAKGACHFDGEKWYVVTIHGQETTIVDGDWIIPEPDGLHFYPCKPDVFKNTYYSLAEIAADGETADPLNDFLCALGEMPPGVTPSEAAIALIQKLQGQIVELKCTAPERAIPSLAKEAYELMVSRSANPDTSFKAWDEMEPFLRETYEGRAASLAVDGLFERCVKEVQGPHGVMFKDMSTGEIVVVPFSS